MRVDHPQEQKTYRASELYDSGNLLLRDAPTFVLCISKLDAGGSAKEVCFSRLKLVKQLESVFRVETTFCGDEALHFERERYK